MPVRHGFEAVDPVYAVVPKLYCKLPSVKLPEASKVPDPVRSPLYEKAVIGAPPVIPILCELNAGIVYNVDVTCSS